ncbi:MAG TPA: mechanosensitive ion channel family protein [Bacteroidia bacterium]|nr:mechanosensitive ion channel family protein [Bacteroidia bacterium]
MSIENYLNYVFWGNPVQVWLLAIGIIIGSFIAIRVFKTIVVTRLKKWSAKTKVTIDDFIVEIVESTLVPLSYMGSIYAGISLLAFSTRIGQVIHVAFMLVITYYILRAITAVIKHLIYSFLRRQEKGEHKIKQARGLIIILNVFLWAIGLVFLIDNLGYNVTTLITGLGIGGIAIALAAQAVLGDLFSYFVIFFDRPFEVGDFIIIGDKMGSVEYIGIKTTRLRTLSGEQLICSNTFLTNAQVHNYKRMETRRVVFSFGVIYQTSREKIEKIPGIVKDIISKKSDRVNFDRAHFYKFGAYSLDFEVVYIAKTSDYNKHMDIQQEIFFELHRTFENEGIKFAYPTQLIYLNADDMPEKEENSKSSRQHPPVNPNSNPNLLQG